MTLNEYYNFPEDANVTLKYTSFFDEQTDSFPCPADMSYAFYRQKRYCIKMFDTANVTNMNYMFGNCNNLMLIPEFNTTNVTDMSNMFRDCRKLTSIPEFNTTNVTNMSNMFSGCNNLTSIPEIDTANVTDMNYMFNTCDNLTSIPPLNCQNINTKNYYPIYKYSNYEYLTDIGGFIDMKMSWDNNYGLAKCPNLTYESCINILNGLYDFTGNGETPNSNQGKLKVNSAFIDLVGEQISIASNKGWVITA